ncbi:MAG: hypothetical protein K2X31_05610 [Sphingopyxis sp.]|nr:hypothetical protein [Sphingopyxis sp.]
MTNINDFSAANLAIMQAYPAVLTALGNDADGVTRFNEIASAVVQPERVSQFFEFVYARHESMPDGVKEAAADVGKFAWSAGFYGLGVDRRGELMERVLRGKSLSGNATAPAAVERYRAMSESVPLPGVAANYEGNAPTATSA